MHDNVRCACTRVGVGVSSPPLHTRTQRLKELQAEAGPDRAVKLRVEVEGGGCSGFQYKFRLDDSVTADDM